MHRHEYVTDLLPCTHYYQACLLTQAQLFPLPLPRLLPLPPLSICRSPAKTVSPCPPWQTPKKTSCPQAWWGVRAWHWNSRPWTLMRASPGMSSTCCERCALCMVDHNGPVLFHMPRCHRLLPNLGLCPSLLACNTMEDVALTPLCVCACACVHAFVSPRVQGPARDF
jgi:hypothetical protein